MYNVLIVDDEPSILEGLVRSVDWGEYGLDVLGTASDGDKALELIKHGRFHILLTDIRMPNMSGIRLIKEIKKMNIAIRTIIMSGYDDFLYVKEAISLGVENYLLKPLNKEELSTTLLTTIQKIDNDIYRNAGGINVFRENLLYRWVSNDIRESEFTERASLIQLEYKSKTFQISLIKIIKMTSSLSDINLTVFSVLDICNEIINCDSREIIFRDINNDIVVVFLGDGLGEQEKNHYSLLNSCLKRIKHDLNIMVFITIGNIIHDYREIYQSYFLAKDLQAYSMITPSDNIIDWHRSYNSSLRKKKIIGINFEVFDNLLLTGKKEELFQMIDHEFPFGLNEKNVSPADIKGFLMEILINILNTVKKKVKSTTGLPDLVRDSLTSIEKLRNPEDLKIWIKTMIGESVDYVMSTSESCNYLVKQVIDYISLNYNTDLSLKAISYIFSVTPSYLGYLFKTETGEMFSNYVNNIRIEKAKEMLLTSNMTASEISKKLGYLHHSHFFKIFKKVTGISPVEFRKKME